MLDSKIKYNNIRGTSQILLSWITYPQVMVECYNILSFKNPWTLLTAIYQSEMQLQYVPSMMKVLCEILKLHHHVSTMHAKILIYCCYHSSSGAILLSLRTKTSCKSHMTINRWILCSIAKARPSPSSTLGSKLSQLQMWSSKLPYPSIGVPSCLPA